MAAVPFATLSSFPAFASVPKSAMKRLERLARSVVYAPGQKVVRRGDPGDRLYLLQAGTAYATVRDADGAWHDDAMTPGDVFGEMALFTGNPRSADITAATRVHCIEVPFAPLRKLFAKAPDVAAFLTDIVGRRLMARSGIQEVGGLAIEHPLGDGGFATVFAAVDDISGERFAVKMLRHELVWRDEYADRFRREAEVIRSIEHPNVVRVERIVDAYATIFIVMELVPGMDLLEYVTRFGPLRPAEVRFVFRRMALALQAAHEQQVVHRDVKPANILVAPDGEPKLLDFGVAITPEEARAEQAGPPMFVGTPHYAAPEHTQCKATDGRTDLFMLGVTAFELLTGNVPNGDDSVMTAMLKAIGGDLPDPREIPGIPDDLGALLYRCMRSDPDERFASCREAVAFLDERGGDERPPAVHEQVELDPDSVGLMVTQAPSKRTPLAAWIRRPKPAIPATSMRTVTRLDFTQELARRSRQP